MITVKDIEWQRKMNRRICDFLGTIVKDVDKALENAGINKSDFKNGLLSTCDRTKEKLFTSVGSSHIKYFTFMSGKNK